jgi:hypothetical protein
MGVLVMVDLAVLGGVTKAPAPVDRHSIESKAAFEK